MNFRPTYRTPIQQMTDVSRDITGKIKTTRKNLIIFMWNMHFNVFWTPCPYFKVLYLSRFSILLLILRFKIHRQKIVQYLIQMPTKQCSKNT